MSTGSPIRWWRAAAEPLLSRHLSMGCGEPLGALSGALVGLTPGGLNAARLIQGIETLGRPVERHTSISVGTRR